jgi:hypothetical protein
LVDTLTENEWMILVERIKLKKCTPFLGAGASYGFLPLGAEIAREWAAEYSFPLEDSANLIAVAQYVALMTDPMFPKDKIVKMIRANDKSPDFNDDSEPHGVLAQLPIPIFVTTNYDDFMIRALRQRDKDARQELCRWNNYVKGTQSAFDTDYRPTVANPVVFHLHGYSPVYESLVLTEDDYLDFLVNISQDKKLIPAPIQEAFMTTSLLFMGYRIADWNFRVLFRSLARFMESGVHRTHFAVITPPAGADSMKQKAQTYLAKYYENIDVRVYWGTAREFSQDLRKRL